MFRYDTYNALLDAADDPTAPDYLERCEAVHDYLETGVDHVPRNEFEAREAFALVGELIPGVTTQIERRTVDALITLRRLEREAREHTQDPFDPPLRHEERILRSLIAYMARPVLVAE